MSAVARILPRLVFALAVCLLFQRPARAACQTTLADLSAYLSWGIQSFQVMDEKGFAEARLKAREALECLSEPIFPEDALRFHLLEALDAYMARDERRVVLAFRGVVAAKANYTLPPELAPPGNPLRALFEEARALPPSAETAIFKASNSALLVDGEVASTRPAERPTILQWVREDGVPLWTGYLLPRSPIPGSVIAMLTEPLNDLASEEEEEPPVAAVSPLPLPVLTAPLQEAPVDVRRGGPARPLLWSAGGALAVSGGLLAVALFNRSTWRSELESCVSATACGADEQELAAMEAQVRNLGYAFQVTAGLGLGLGLAAVVTTPW